MLSELKGAKALSVHAPLSAIVTVTDDNQVSTDVMKEVKALPELISYASKCTLGFADGSSINSIAQLVAFPNTVSDLFLPVEGFVKGFVMHCYALETDHLAQM